MLEMAAPDVAPPEASGEFHHHVSRDRVVLQRVYRQILSIARAFESTVRHLAHEREMRVYPRATVLQACGHRHGFRHVPRPHGGSQPVLRVVGPLDRLLRLGKARHGDNRAEYLPLYDLVALESTGHYGWLIEKAAS